mmetsp:Transcript_13227/g.37734  ORF Transcript_13227/g.37734 Transcript_13227/m.37734 type:complete len:320 (+) Transcript_13227:1207-2166(+)
MLVDGGGNDLAILTDTVKLNLNSSLNEVGNDDGVLTGHVGCLGEACSELLLSMSNVHGGATENVTGTDEDRISNIGSEFHGSFGGRQLLPFRLLNANLINHVRELVAVLCVVDHLGRCTEKLGARGVKRQSNTVGDLSTDADNNTIGIVPLVNVKYSLPRELLEVQAVTFIIIRADSLGVVVDDGGLVTKVSKSANTAYTTPIELNRGANSIGTRAQRNDATIGTLYIILHAMISHVKVVGSGGIFGRECVDLLRKRRNVVSLALVTDIILGVSALETLRDLNVRVAILLGLEHKILRHFVETDLLHLVPSLDNGLQAA